MQHGKQICPNAGVAHDEINLRECNQEQNPLAGFETLSLWQHHASPVERLDYELNAQH